MKDQLRAVNEFTRAPLKSYAPHNLIKSGGRAVLRTQQTLQSNTSLFSPPEMVVSPSSVLSSRSESDLKFAQSILFTLLASSLVASQGVPVFPAGTCVNECSSFAQAATSCENQTGSTALACICSAYKTLEGSVYPLCTGRADM